MMRVSLVWVAMSDNCSGDNGSGGRRRCGGRGKQALLGKCYTPPTMTRRAYETIWKQWGLKEKPARPTTTGCSASATACTRPLPQRRPADGPASRRRCPSGSARASASTAWSATAARSLGKSYVGLGNATLDYPGVLRGDGRRRRPSAASRRSRFCNVRGTNEAGGMAVYLLGFREPDLRLRRPRLDLDLHDDLCEDVPAWWLLKKKKTMYHTGGADARSVRSLMQFMMSPLNSADDFTHGRGRFQGHPRVPAVAGAAEVSVADRPRAGRQGRGAVRGQLRPLPRHLRREVDLSEQDRARSTRSAPTAAASTASRRSSASTTTRAGSHGRTITATATTDGYQAPPLDGIWATAPVLPQRLGADGLSRPQLEGPAQGLHALLPHRPATLTTR